MANDKQFDYKQRPTTKEYRDNWDKIFKPKKKEKPEEPKKEE